MLERNVRGELPHELSDLLDAILQYSCMRKPTPLEAYVLRCAAQVEKHKALSSRTRDLDLVVLHVFHCAESIAMLYKRIF